MKIYLSFLSLVIHIVWGMIFVMGYLMLSPNVSKVVLVLGFLVLLICMIMMSIGPQFYRELRKDKVIWLEWIKFIFMYSLPGIVVCVYVVMNGEV